MLVYRRGSKYRINLLGSDVTVAYEPLKLRVRVRFSWPLPTFDLALRLGHKRVFFEAI